MTRAYNQKFAKGKRRALRKYATYAEKILWMSLRHKGIEGVRFLRQYSIRKFIIDFYSPSIKLGIEVDGESHIGNEQYDKERQEFIESYGIKIIRFTDDEIIGNINKVIETITNIVKAKQ